MLERKQKCDTLFLNMWIWERKKKDVAKRSGFHAFLFLLLGSGLIYKVEASRHVGKNMTTSSGLVGASPGEAAKLRVSWLVLSKAVRVQTSMGKGGGWLVTGTSFSAPQVGPECEGVKKCPYLLGRGCGGLIVSLDHQRSAVETERSLCEGPHDQSHRSKSTNSHGGCHRDAFIDSAPVQE